jgi:hypothetical protein
MNLNDVFNLPEKQWTPKNDPVAASILSVGQQKEDQYGYKQPIVLTDISGASHELTVQTKYVDGLIRPDEVGKSMMWLCKWYSGKQGKKLVGYTTTARKATTPVINTQTPTHAARAVCPSQMPAQQLDDAASAYQSEQNDKARGMVRHGVVCAYITTGAEPVVGQCEYWVEYIMTGKAPPPPGQVPNEPIQQSAWEH